MLIKFLLTVILDICGGIEVAVLPRLPAIFTTIWNFFLEYLGQGVKFFSVTFHAEFWRGLLSWWINMAAIIFVAEVIYHLWVIFTGNDNHGSPVLHD